jgi:two-component system C4-dicarboxylate transport sensor histidine kinase DctB
VEIGLLPPCYGDAERIEQVFSNLFGNALKAVARSEEAQIKIYGYYSEQAVEFCVEDNGCGMGARQLDHVFDLFFTSGEQQNAALGLGLSIVKSIVEKHGGGVWAESRPQGGTKFTVRLPKTEYKTNGRRHEVVT